jgi:hypothetical protein
MKFFFCFFVFLFFCFFVFLFSVFVSLESAFVGLEKELDNMGFAARN